MTTTELGRGELADLVAQWMEGRLVAHERILAGTINSNYRVDVERDGRIERFFLRVNEGKTVADVGYEVNLVVALAKAGVATPAPIETAAGGGFARVDGLLVSLFEWREGEHREASAVRVADATKVGGALASLHRASATLPEEFGRAGIYRTEDIAVRYAGFRDHSDPALRDAIDAIGRELDDLAARAAQRAALPRAIIHGDLFRDNVLFDGDELVALLDFEQAATGAPLYDLAVCINAWCYRARDFEATLVAALLSGYLAARDLPEATPEALWIECRAAAVRFAVTRITDVHLAGLSRSGKSFSSYLERLKRWHEYGPGVLEPLM